MKMEKAVSSGSSAALALVKTLLTKPALIGMTDESANMAGKALAKINMKGAPFYIPLDVTHVSQEGVAEVSENMVIAAGENRKKYITDSVAPGPWRWNIQGYIPGNSLIEKTNKFTPFVTLNREIVKRAYKQGLRMIYKDVDCLPYKNVVIESLTIETQPDCQNKTPFSMTLKQIEILEAAESDMDTTEAMSTAATGSAGGGAVETGAKGTEAINKTDLSQKTGIGEVLKK